MNKQRIEWIDMAKGYGILMVILGHINWGLPHMLVYSCHLPLFFFLSGYVFGPKENFKRFTRSKLKGILLPYFLLAIPMVYFIALFEKGYSMQAIPWIIIAFFTQNRMSTLWYMGALFILSFLFYAIVRLTKTARSRWIIVIIGTLIGLIYAHVGGPSLPWNIDTAFVALIFFAAGYELKCHQDAADQWYTSKKKGFRVFLGIAALLVNLITNLLSWFIAHEGLEMYYSKYGCEPLVLISAFSGIAFICMISRGLTLKPIRYIGKNSLLYFAWHQAIAIPIFENLFERYKFSLWLYRAGLPQWLMELAEFILVLLFMTVIVVIFNLIKKSLFKKKAEQRVTL